MRLIILAKPIPIIDENREAIRLALLEANRHYAIASNTYTTYMQVKSLARSAQICAILWLGTTPYDGFKVEVVSGGRKPGVERRRGTLLQFDHATSYRREPARYDSVRGLYNREIEHCWRLLAVGAVDIPWTGGGGFCPLFRGKSEQRAFEKRYPTTKRFVEYGNPKQVIIDNRATSARRSKAGKASPATDAGPSGGDSAHEGQSVAAMGSGRSQDAPGIVGTVLD